MSGDDTGLLEHHLARIGLAAPPPATLAGLRELHTSDDSPFRRFVAQRTERDGQRAVRNLVHHVATPTGREARDLTTYDEWRAALADDLRLPVADVSDDEWSVLWERAQASHRAWDAAGRP